MAIRVAINGFGRIGRLVFRNLMARSKEFDVVAINVNTIEADRLDKMQERAKEKAFPYPYLYDETQKIAKDYGATSTPEFFILDKDRKKIADGLSRLLADTYTLYLKTHNFHWNVTGPMFNTLHLMFETQYNELALAVDAIAERIRALGVAAPGSYKEFAKLSSIPEADGVPAAEDMIRQLVEGQEAVVRTAREIFPATEAANDEPTADLLTQRMLTHEKTAWMLRAMLA